MKGLGYRGILDIGYRNDARDGQYNVLEGMRLHRSLQGFAGRGVPLVRSTGGQYLVLARRQEEIVAAQAAPAVKESRR